MNLQRLCYIHIPKTAGTAVTDVLRKIYPPNKIFGGTLMPDYTSVDPREFQHYLLYKGHVHYSFARKNLPKDTRYVTVLRDPVDRIFSLYFFIRNLPTTTLDALNLPAGSRAGASAARENGIVEYLQSSVPDVVRTTRNHQLRVLVDTETFGRIETDPDYVVSQAWSNMQHFLCYGIQEFLPFFVDELSRKLGRPDYSLGRINQNRDKPHQMQTVGKAEMDRARQLILEYNQAEIDLYNKVRAAVIARTGAQTHMSWNS